MALILELIEIADHDNAVEDGLAEEGDETDRGGNTQRKAGDEQREYSADESQRHVYQNQQRALHRFERVEEEDKNEKGADRHNEREALHRPLLVLEFAA